MLRKSATIYIQLFSGRQRIDHPFFQLRLSGLVEGRVVSGLQVEIQDAHPLVRKFLGMQVHSEYWNELFYQDFRSLPVEVLSFLRMFKHYAVHLESRPADTILIVRTPLEHLFWSRLLSFQPLLLLPGLEISLDQPGTERILELQFQSEQGILAFPGWKEAWYLPCDWQDYLITRQGLQLLHSPLQRSQLISLFAQGVLALDTAMKQSLFERQDRQDRYLKSYLEVPERAEFLRRTILYQFREDSGEFTLDAFICGHGARDSVRLPLEFAALRQQLLLGESIILEFSTQMVDVLSPTEEFYDHLKMVVQQSFHCFYELLNEVEGNRIRTHDREALFERYLPALQDLVEIEQQGQTLSFRSQTVDNRTVSVVDALPDTGQSIDWLEVRFAFSVDGLSLDLEEIQEMLSRGYVIKQGRMLTFTSDDRLQFHDFFQRLDAVQSGKNWQIRRFRLPQLLSENIHLELPPSLKDLPRELDKEKALVKVPVHPQLKGILRAYQKTGVYWLSFLNRFHFGGILADEMGLGKTLQVLVFLENIRGEGVSLIVCPSSLVYNWAQEIDKFMGGRLRYTLIQGNREKRISQVEKLDQYDVAITSYNLVHLDKDLYQERCFHYCILDEAQHIKNKSAKRTMSIKDICSQHRIAITGTPIENNVGELWSVFDFLMPGFLGSHSSFREEFENPINGFDKKASRNSFNLLKKLIHPFVLRRTKDMVYKELPPKIEQVLTLELSDAQKSLYLDTLSRVRTEFFPVLEDKGPEGSYLEFLAALTRLRQICLHPGLVYAEYAGTENDPELSVKLQALIELVQEAMDSGQRVLIFSQFVSMLRFIRREFHRNEIEYLYMDGKTRDRVGLVEHFNRSDIPVFLISLKAGGTGLNLTGANVVILFDPWWNPAVENQAIDRAHRIGQHRTVNVYRLMTRGTIEEKIFQLQQRKKMVFDEVMQAEQGFIQNLKKEDILEIFQALSEQEIT